MIVLVLTMVLSAPYESNEQPKVFKLTERVSPKFLGHGIWNHHLISCDPYL